MQTKNRSQISLETYLTEIGQESLINADDEIELAKRIKKNDPEALDKLVKANLRFVVSVAKNYQKMGMPLTDLINEGNIGLIKAAKRFDETKGFKFISYAVWWIRQQILQALAEQSRAVRLPLNRIGEMNKISKALDKLEKTLQRKPTLEEIADYLDTSPEAIFKTHQFSRSHLSLDAPMSEGQDNRLLDVLEDSEQQRPDSHAESEGIQYELADALNTLTEKEAKVIRLYYGIGTDQPLTLEEIGEQMSFTRERARQIKEKALRRLRFASRSNKLRKYLE